MIKHGMRKTRIWYIWSHMKGRCLNKSDKAYKNYGGRGVKICDKWLNFIGFYEDMWGSYRDDLTIERINVDGDYCLTNCKWIKKGEQSFNTRRTIYVKLNGVRRKLHELVKESGISYNILYKRIIVDGMTPENALGHLPRRVRVSYNGITKSVGMWAKNLGMEYHIIYNRLFKYKMPPEKALTSSYFRPKRS